MIQPLNSAAGFMPPPLIHALNKKIFEVLPHSLHQCMDCPLRV